ncbi:MAG: hypothetical protein PHW79_02960 [Candidatus Marinimicrobia bacterium]|nr:hypothetical protein [Candidatus Neomarinimicrobiota bacterium]
MKRLSCWLFVLVLFLIGDAQEKKVFWDGFDWMSVTKVTREYPEYAVWIKSAYLSGLLDGKIFYELKAMSVNSRVADSTFKDLIQSAQSRELIEGLDAFYRDETRKYVPIPSALIAIRMLQLNYPEKEVDQFIRESKKWINELTKQLIIPSE